LYSGWARSSPGLPHPPPDRARGRRASSRRVLRASTRSRRFRSREMKCPRISIGIHPPDHSRRHSPPVVASGCPPAGGCRLCPGEPPPASRSSPCATPAGGLAPAPSALGRSGCSGATGARPLGTIPPGSPPVAPPPNGPSGATRPAPRSPGSNGPGRGGTGRAAAPTGYLPIGKSAAPPTLSMAKKAAVPIMMIFMMLF